MNIKVEKVNQVNKLFEVIDSCTMNVELVTGEGDCLNMKSKLSQYLSMTRMFGFRENVVIVSAPYSKRYGQKAR